MLPSEAWQYRVWPVCGMSLPVIAIIDVDAFVVLSTCLLLFLFFVNNVHAESLQCFSTMYVICDVSEIVFI